MPYILFTGIFDICFGLLASLNSFGVTLFTLSSVHCALSKTAINNSYTFLWLSGTGVLGYILFKIF